MKPSEHRMIFRQSVLHKYFLYYLSIALTGCVLVVVLLFNVSASALNASLQAAEAKKLTLVSEDLSAQLSLLKNISYQIYGAKCYQPAYLARSRFYEIDMLEDLGKYKTHSPIASDLFMLYDGSDDIFHHDGKMPFPLYAQTQLNWPAQSTQALYEAITSTADFQVITLPEDNYLLCYALVFSSSQSENSRAWLSAYVPHAALMRRIELCSGGFESRVDIAYGSAPEGSLNACTVEGFTVSLMPSADSEYGELLRFRRLCTRLSLLSTLLLVSLGLVLAYMTYLPLHRVFTHHKSIWDKSALGTDDELTLLDNALTQAIHHRRLSETQLDTLLRQVDAQRRSLRESLLLALLNGESSPQTLEAMRVVSINLDGPWFSAALLSWESEALARNIESLIQSIESLTTDGTGFYAVPLDSRPMLVVLVSSDDDETFPALTDILSEIFEMEMRQPPRIGCGRPVSSLAQIPASLSDAMLKTVPQQEVHSQQAESAADLLLQAVRQGNCAAALSSLNEINDILTRRFPAPAMQSRVYADVIGRLSLLSQSRGIPLNPERAARIGEHPLDESSQRELRLIIAEICDAVKADPAEPADPRGEQIVAYIREHLLDYDLSLEMISGAFGLSGKQIGRLIARESGMSYKELLIDLRIARAKELLLAGESVSSVCERLHYASAPYFIKLFREKTGFTPAKYQKTHSCGE